MIPTWGVRFAVITLMTFFLFGKIGVAAVPGDEQVVARVNGVNITKGEVRQRVEIYERAHPGLAPGESRVRRASTAAQILVYSVLEEQLAQALGVSVSDAEVETQYNKVRGRQEEGMFTAFL